MRIILYSVLIGEYDAAPPELEPQEGVDYILFTNRSLDLRSQPHWNVWKNPAISYGTPSDDRRASRVVKLNPTIHLPTHDVSIYVDSNIRIKRAGFERWCVEQLGERHIAAPAHIERRGDMAKFPHDCLYGEAETCIALGLDNREVIEQQVRRYRAMGFPERFGLLENCVLVRKSSPLMSQLAIRWSYEYFGGSQRDQCSLMFALWNLGIEWKTLPIHARNNEWYEQRLHLKSRKVC